MYRKSFFVGSFIFILFVSASANAGYSRHSGHYFWWNNFSDQHLQDCKKNKRNNHYWGRFFRWHNYCPNQRPIADAGMDREAVVGDSVTLDASGSSDSDGEIRRYRWVQVWGPRVRLSDRRSPAARFTAPEVTKPTELTFILKVTDDRRARDKDLVVITILPGVTSAPPVAHAGMDQTVDEDTVVSLDGSASADPDNDITSYSWVQTAGSSVALTNDNSVVASFTAPSLVVAETLNFQLTVTDAEGNVASDSIAVTVEPVIATSDVNVRIKTLDASLVSGVTLEFYVNGEKREDLGSTINGTAALTIDADVNYSIRTSAAGYAVQVVPFKSAQEGGNVDLGITLIPRGSVTGISGAGTFTEQGSDGAAVNFDSSDFVDANGNPVIGDIELSITPVDVSQPATLAAFPGEFTGILESDGTETPIISFGTVEFHFTADGEPINLAPGATADVLIPIYSSTYQDGSDIVLGDAIPLWSLNEDTGIWTQEGNGTVVVASDSPTGFALSATVSHFSWWNCDVSMNAARVEVTVLGTDNGTATVFGRTLADIGFRPSLVDTTIPVNGTTNPLPIPSSVETCFWARVNFDNGSTVTTPEQCVTPAASEQLTLVFGTGSSEPLDVLALPGDASDMTFVMDFIFSPIDSIVISPVSVESQVAYSVSAGVLPAGIVLSTINGTQAEIAGIANESGTFTATILATDDEGNTDEVIINFDISADVEPPLLNCQSYFVGGTGPDDAIVINLNDYNMGGLAANWSLSESILPVWLTFDSTGLFTVDPSLIPEVSEPSDETENEQPASFYSDVTAVNVSGDDTGSIGITTYADEGISIWFTANNDTLCFYGES